MTLSLLLLSSRASAIDPPGEPLAIGTPAPFAGILLSPERSLKLGMKAHFCDLEKAIDVDRAIKEGANEVAYVKKLHAIDQEAWDTKEARLRESIPPSWLMPVVVVSVVVGTALTTFGLLWLADKMGDELVRP